MDPSSSIATMSYLEQPIALVWEQVQKELKRAKDAQEEFEILTEFNGHMRRLLNKAYSKEVIDEQLTSCIKRLWRSLFDSEDAIEDLCRRDSECKWKRPFSALHHFNNKRTFTRESRGIIQSWKDYAANRGITTPIETAYGLASNNHAQSTSAGHGSSSDAFFCKKDKLVGIEGPVNELVRCLTRKASMPRMIFVHGVQGVGKTSLVAAVLCDENVKSHFKYCVWIEDLRSWELADKTEAALMEANATIWTLTMGEVDSRGSPVKLGEAFERMKENVGSMPDEFSWALVLDDAGRVEVFRSLLGLLIETRPSVLVTTRVRSLKSSDMGYLKSRYDVHNFEHVFLSENDSRSLLCRTIWDTDEDLLKCENSSTLKDASYRILRRCQGSPLMILATGRLLKNNNQFRVAATPDAVQWTDWSGRLEEKLLSNGHVVDANGRKITLRMDHLLDVLKCLFYLSIFPLDRPIRCSTMMRLWMAEGFIEQEGSQPVHEKAEEILEKLLEHNLIREKRTSYGRVKTGRVHNVLHQIIISKSKDEAFAMIVASPIQRLPKNVRYLSFHCPMEKIDNGTSVELLRSLHFFEKVHPPSLKKLLEKVERLKVLDFQRYLTKEEKMHPPASLDTFPKKILRSKYLTYLSLKGTDVKIIPNKIKDLAYLESLDLRETLVEELPEEILKLKALCHLLVSRSNRSQATDTDLEVGVKAPSKLGDLTLLQKLCMIELKPVNGGNQCERELLLEELGKLTNLQRLGLSMLESTDAELLCSSIKKLTKLVTLRLIAAPEAKIDLSKKDMGRVVEHLQRVHLTGRLETLPEWILCSDSLVKLVLKRSRLTVYALQQLGKSRSLEHLELEQAFDVTDMRFEEEKFKKLRFLGLDRFDKLESIQVDRGALPTLERLSLARCNSLTSVPPFITRPTKSTKLKCLELCGMHKEFDTAVKAMMKELHLEKVKFKEWKDPALEQPKPLPTRGPGISSVHHQCRK